MSRLCHVGTGAPPRARRGGASSASAVAAAAVVAATLTLSAAACSPSAQPPRQDGFGAGTPEVGACRVLTASDIAPTSNSTPTVSCSSPHTAVTIAVGGFPAADVTNRTLTNGMLGNEALQRCTAAWKRTVGGTVSAQHLTVLGLAYYLPTPHQLSQGARWYRCDLVLGGSDGMPLKDLPAHVQGILRGTVPDGLVACRTAPDFDNGHEVACSSRHVLRAVGIAPLPDQARYPGAAQLKTAAAKGCQPVVRRWLHGRFSAGTAYQWPDQVSWTLLHDHSATCWAVTTH